jgi:uncharacterized membrane protein
MKKHPFPPYQKWQDDPDNWIFGFLYFNSQDHRVFVSKRIPWAGSTLNFANPKSYLAILVAIGFFGFILYMVTKNGN